MCNITAVFVPHAFPFVIFCLCSGDLALGIFENAGTKI